MMTIETFFVAVLPYQSQFMFCAGLLTSIICCLAALVIQSTVQRRPLEPVAAPPRSLTYQRFREELNLAPRHVEFARDEIHELEDGDFHSV